MEIAIIGAGFTGLAAAYYLSKQGIKVTVFEKESHPGGLAVGFKDPKWNWTIEQHYHHWFVSDLAIQKLAKEINHPVIFVRPKTSTWFAGQISQLDSPISLLTFKALPLIDRLRTCVGLAAMRFNPFWKMFEFATAEKYIKTVMGKLSWDVLWGPLFVGKFAFHYPRISATWFWARIFKRSSSLGYPQGGFQSLAMGIEAAAKKYGAQFVYDTEVKNLSSDKLGKVTLSVQSKNLTFDSAIFTLPTFLFLKIAPSLPEDYKKKYQPLSGIGAVNLVLALKKQFLSDGTYWLNINDRDMPYLAIVEHTNFMSPKDYGDDHLLYVGNYLAPDHPYFKKTADELVEEFLPHLKKINPDFKTSWIRKSWVFKAPFAQPIVTPHYSQVIPPLTTPLPNVYLANIQQVYPYDRGTTYAVELGKKAAHLCTTKSNHS